MEINMNCQFCGKPSKFFQLCKQCNELKDQGIIVKCEKCDTWHYANENCPTCNPTENIITQKSDLKCIICGEPSNGKHFCLNCYKKYKDKSIDIRITNCITIEILDKYGNRQYKCDDGHYVRSRAEKIINDFLFREKVRAIYEEPIYYKENGKDKTLKPDFYLPDYDIYIEYNEINTKAYLKNKEYAMQIYKELNKTVIIMDDNDLTDIKAFLKPKLNLH